MKGNIPWINVLGTKVAALDLHRTVEVISTWLVNQAGRRYVSVTDVHCIMQAQRRSEVRHAYNSADLCVPDGMPLTWLGHRRGYESMGRVYGPDLMLALLEISPQMEFSHYFLGGAPGVAEDLKVRMVKKFPGLQVVGTFCPPFRALTGNERADLVANVAAAKPDILWIGLGAPKQDLFMAEFIGILETKVMIGVGAAFDFHTDRIRQAPRWMMNRGLEWLFRLMMEPGRLGPRYFRNNPAFIWHILLQEIGLRQYPTD